MKMTIHQRLRAQRKAEHELALSRRHRRAVTRDHCAYGTRCYGCWDVPLSTYEAARMTDEDWLDWTSIVEQGRKWSKIPCGPDCRRDSVAAEIALLLGYSLE